MAKTPTASKARTKSKDTDGAPPAPGEATASAGAASGADPAESKAGDEGSPPSASAVSDSAEAGKGDEAGAGPASDPAPSDPGEEQECLVVAGPARGRRRCGVRFGPQPEAIPIAWLRPYEVAAIEADPMLTVTREMRVVRPR